MAEQIPFRPKEATSGSPEDPKYQIEPVEKTRLETGTRKRKNEGLSSLSLGGRTVF